MHLDYRCDMRDRPGDRADGGGFHMPELLDKFMEATMFRQQQSDRPSSPGRVDALFKRI